ncbi:NAD-dependent protein deacetylase [Aphelenchoides bicaudatus]|nr:NAD-dependent protein deacetylase [Aphelenchoides bicaudatus]
MADKDELIESTADDKKKPDDGDEKQTTSKEKPSKSEKADQAPEQSSKFIPNIYNRFVQSFENALSQIIDEPTPKAKLNTLDLEGVANFIKSKQLRNIVFMCGAGISTSAGVPDFRSPGSGLYDNLQKYKLPDPQAIFEMNFFQRNPEPFYSLCRELFLDTVKPTPCHYFMRLMTEKGFVRRIFTQNIDSLEYIAGINQERVVAAHGSYQESRCLKCKKTYTREWLEDFLRQKEVLVPKCSCGGLIKPNIVFFGENLPARFFTSAINDFPKCELLIIIGTSLVVQPFASMIHEVSDEVPRLLINLESVGKVSKRERAHGVQGLSYDEADNVRDVFWKGTADEGVWELAELLGFKDEFHQLIETSHKELDKKLKASKKSDTSDETKEKSKT